MFTSIRQTSPIRLAIFLLCAITAYRLWFITQIELLPDEAYYWLWSKHLAASYRDKGPLVAWVIALGTKLFGDTPFGVRIFAVLFSSGASCLLFVIARRLYDGRTALWSLLVATVMPMFAVGSLLMTIDPLSVFFWILTALIFWNALQTGKTLPWFWMGLTIGAGFMAKFTNGVQIICICLFLLFSKEYRSWLFSRKMFFLGAAFLLSVAPLLWWNMQNDWIHVAALHSRSGVKNSFGIHPKGFFRFVGEVFGVISPLLAAGLVIANVALLWKRHRDLRIRFLLSQCVPLVALFLFFSLNAAGKSNWIAPALMTSIILAVVYWREKIALHPAWRWSVGIAFAIALIMSAVLHNTAFLHLPPKLDPLRRAQGWADFASHVSKARTAYNAELLIANHYSQAAMMSFYLPDRPVTFLPPEEFGKTQFSLWPTYEVRDDTRALFVTNNTKLPPPKTLQEQFSKITLVDDFISLHHGRPMTRFRIYLCTRD